MRYLLLGLAVALLLVMGLDMAKPPLGVAYPEDTCTSHFGVDSPITNGPPFWTFQCYMYQLRNQTHTNGWCTNPGYKACNWEFDISWYRRSPTCATAAKTPDEVLWVEPEVGESALLGEDFTDFWDFEYNDAIFEEVNISAYCSTEIYGIPCIHRGEFWWYVTCMEYCADMTLHDPPENPHIEEWCFFTECDSCEVETW